jgi:histidyl-tRNA synthetase
MLEKNLFPTVGNMITQVLFINFGDQEAMHVMELLQKLRAAGINSEMYPEPAKMKKQMKYANDRNIPFVALVGENEIASNTIQIKNMETGEQESVSVEDVIQKMGATR